MATTKTSSSVAQIRRLTANDSLSIVDMLQLCLRYWYWFVISITVIMSLTVLYLLSTPKVYTRTTSILVKSNSVEKSNEMKMFEELGVSNLSTNIRDEIVAIHSPASVYEMVKRLRLNLDYKRPGLLSNTTAYADNLPIQVEFMDLKDNEEASFTLDLKSDGSAILSDMMYQGKAIKNDICIPKLNRRCKTPYGILVLRTTIAYTAGMEDRLLVKRIGYASAAAKFGSSITAMLQPDTRNIIDIVCQDECIPRADNILSTIVNIYNENWVKNRNQISVATNAFIKERLSVIEEELGHVDKDISDYKSMRAMPSVEAAAGQALGLESSSEALGQQLSNQLYMVRYMRNFISNEGNSHQLLPASSGIVAVEKQIAEYNRKQLERNNLVANSSEQNPLVQDLDVGLMNLRIAILNTLDNEQTTIAAQLNTVRMAYSQARARLSVNPQQAKDLLSSERQQKVKESLYLFLLQKREENELSQAFTAYNTRIIAAPYGSSSPTTPQSKRIMLIAFIISLVLPAAFFIIRENLNTVVRGRKDLENLTIPYVGELPFWKSEKSETGENSYQIVVQQHKRDIVNEAFRVVRTNLEFMTNSEKGCKVFMLTSFNPGSGKTFIAANLASCFGIRGSKVLCIDLDLRRASLSELVDSPKKGISDYLTGREPDYRPLLVHKEDSFVDFLPVGKMPPNPTELLYSPRFKPMLNEMRQQYDYIFIDCPPVEIVADSSIVNNEVDVTLFIVRAGLLQRAMLPELEKNYQDRKYKNMAIILNCTDAEFHYGYHRYGYAYGRYGYGKQGYGYYGNSKKEKS